jgi:hypothetical protein
MPWVRLSDDFYDHPKIMEVGPLGLSVWVAGLAYCNRNLTDGVLPESVAKRLMDFDGVAYQVASVGDFGGVLEDDCAPLAIELLVNAGLLHREGHGCARCPQPKSKHLVYHDYLEFQPSAAEIQADREAAKERMRRARDARRSGEVRPNIDGTAAELRVTPTPTPTQEQKTSSTAVDAEFEEFYRAYPRHIGRGQAVKAWKNAKKKAEPSAIIGAALKFKERTNGSDPHFIAHPSTWLNGERWADQDDPDPEEDRVDKARRLGIPEGWI